MTTSSSRNKKCWRRRVFRGVLGLSLLLVVLAYFGFVLPFWGVPFNQSRHGRVPLIPPWALECWLWEDDANHAAAVKELLEGYARHDLPVRTVLIDSPWSTRYNDFTVDSQRYPKPEQFFSELRARGYRVVLWMTCMVNSFNKDTAIRESPDFFAEARTNGFLAGNGLEIQWWKGRGGFVDYSNPAALQWWRARQQQVFDWGLDGWKLDGTDTLFQGRIGKLPLPINRAHSGWLTTRQYMDHYARKEYEHGLTQNPAFITLIRAKDKPWVHPEGFAPLDAAPVTWVGDNQHAWKAKERGLEAAIRDILASARLGYCVIGSDVGGYHGRFNPDALRSITAAQLSAWSSPDASRHGAGDEFNTASPKDPIPPQLYIRWAQFSAFCGLFLNGGHGERRLWKRTPAELEIIRKFSWLHTELVPYMYSHVVECHRGGLPLMRPLRSGKFHYRFGDDFLVAPIHEDKLARTAVLPRGRWRYLFDDREVLTGPARITRDFPLDEYPVFVRSGAIIPLNVSRAYTDWGDADSAGFTTWLIYPDGSNQFTLFHPETHPEPAATTVTVNGGRLLTIEFSGRPQPHILRIHSPQKPAAVRLDGETLSEDGAWRFDDAAQRLIITTRAYARGRYDIAYP